MPMLDVSFIALDPMLADTFDVLRRLNAVGTNGRVSALGDQLFEDVVGVVTQQDPADLIRAEDGQTIPRRIFIASSMQFIALGPDYQPDEITWNGTVYTVSQVLPYSRFGQGLYECIAEYRNAVPPFQ